MPNMSGNVVSMPTCHWKFPISLFWGSKKALCPTNRGCFALHVLSFHIVTLVRPHFLGQAMALSLSVLTSRTAGYGPVCPVVWEGRPVRGVPIPIGKNVSCQDPPPIFFHALSWPLPKSGISIITDLYLTQTAGPKYAVTRWIVEDLNSKANRALLCYGTIGKWPRAVVSICTVVFS